MSIGVFESASLAPRMYWPQPCSYAGSAVESDGLASGVEGPKEEWEEEGDEPEGERERAWPPPCW